MLTILTGIVKTSQVAQTSVFEVCGWSTMNPEKAPALKVGAPWRHSHQGIVGGHATAGRIKGNLPRAVSVTPGDGVLRTRLGRGGTHVQLRTIRGNIRVVEKEELL